MARGIKGLVVEIGGDTSGLQKALQQAKTASTNLTTELSKVNKSLKLDTSSPELLAQKQKVLNESIEKTSTYLEELKKHEKDVLESGVELTGKNAEKYRELQREIITTENKLNQMKFDNSNFAKLGDSLDKVGTKITEIGNKANQLGNTLSKYVTVPIAGIVSAGITANANIEKMTTSMSTFLGSTQEAEKVVEQIREDAAKTSFDTSSFIKANQMLISTGESADEATKTIKALGDAVTATGGGNDELVRMSSNLQQIKNAGKATAMDIRQFAYAGIDVYGILADYMGKTTEEIKKMDISYEDLSKALQKASLQGGKYFGAMEKSSGTLTGQLNKLKASTTNMLAELTKSLMPVAKDLIAKVDNLVKKFNTLSDDEKKQIVNIGLIVAAIGPLTKILGTVTSTIGGVVKGFGTFTTAIGVMKTGVESANKSANSLAKGLSALTSPVGLAATAITVAVGVIVAQMQRAKEESQKQINEMFSSFGEWGQAVRNAEGYLSGFNSTLFASNEEQQQLATNMQNIQNKITQVCQNATKERRNLTDGEITKVKEYLKQLEELSQKELELQKTIGNAIEQQAQSSLAAFQGSAGEYKALGEQWVATAEQQKENIIAIATQRATEEIALLNQAWGDKATLDNAEYAAEYNRIIENKEKQIKEAQDQVQRTYSIVQSGYKDRISESNNFKEKYEKYLGEVTTAEEKYNNSTKYLFGMNGEAALEYAKTVQKSWDESVGAMSKAEKDEVATWLSMVADTELYGGQISEEDQKTVDTILSAWDKLEPEAKKEMKSTMEGMLQGLKDKEPTLFEKASGIATGIISRLRKSFDINSPSRVMRKLFNYVGEGAIIGLEDEEKDINKEIDRISNLTTSAFQTPQLAQGHLSAAAPTQNYNNIELKFYPQTMTDAELDKAFNYVNRKLGTAY